MTTTATPERRPTRRSTRRAWWGAGASPTALWPNVTIDLPAVWRGGRWESPDGRFWFDAKAADAACAFFPDYLRHHIGEFAGRPFDLLDYQSKLLTRPLFGWKRASDNLRRFSKVFAFLPKGAGKSPWGAGTGLYLTLCDGEPAAEVYAVAGDRKQARVVHDNARVMVEESDALSELCEVLRDSIYCSANRSRFVVLSSDGSLAHGARPHAVIFDEFHVQRNRHLYEALKKSMVKRRQPVIILLSHAGDDDESICAEEYDYAKGVLSGTIQDDSCLPVIFEAAPDDDWADPAVWRRVNPGHGITVQETGIARECAEAQAEPRKLNDFLKFTLNRWVNQATAWIPIDWWDACAVEGIPDDSVQGLTCAAGLDLAQKYDLAAFVVTFRTMLDEAIKADVVTEAEGVAAVKAISLNYAITAVPFFWIPEDTMRQREHEDGIPYTEWVRAGLVTATEGSVIDYSRIYHDITTKIVPRFPLLKQGLIGYDPAFATDIAIQLRDRAGLKVHEVLQNYTHLSEPAQIFEALTKGRRVRHDGNRTLRNHIETVSVKRDDAGRIRPVKPRKAGKRIDGVPALLMGLRGLMLTPPQATKSKATPFWV
jgi:phage terminase large subunit-like protein